MHEYSLVVNVPSKAASPIYHVLIPPTSNRPLDPRGRYFPTTTKAAHRVTYNSAMYTPSLIHRPKPITTTSSPKAQCRSPKPHADCHGQHNQHQRCALPTGPTSGLHPTLTHTFSRETNKQSSQHKISRQLYITRPSPQGATSAPTPLNFC